MEGSGCIYYRVLNEVDKSLMGHFLYNGIDGGFPERCRGCGFEIQGRE